MTTRSELVARSYLASFATADPDQIATHVSDDFVNQHTAALGAGCESKAAYRERLPAFLEQMVGLRYEVEDVVVCGDRVAVFYEMVADWQGDTPIRVKGAQRLLVIDGLIAHRTDYWDSATFLVQADPAARAVLQPFGIS